MSELSGSLIQMNAHAHLPDYAQTLVMLGILLGLVFIILLILELIFREKWTRTASLLLVLILLCTTAFYIGYTRPREKIIMACVNGPISIERISGVYDILEIDGKMLKLRER